jgi:hypothetical protein
MTIRRSARRWRLSEVPAVNKDDKEMNKTPVIQPGDRLIVDLDDADGVADFLEFTARLIREKRRITISVS